MSFNSTNSGPIVVIGGGFGGLTTVLSLSKFKSRPEIILIEPRKRFVFLPLLYELLSEELKLWEVAPLYKNLLIEKGIVLVEDCVEKIEIEKKLIITSSGKKINYSQLVISTGSKSQTYGIKGINQHCLFFNQLEDVARLKKLISDLNQLETQKKSLIIVGAGATGVELACKISDLLQESIEVLLIEFGRKVLPRGKSFNQEQLQNTLDRKSIKVYLGKRVTSVTSNTVEIENAVSEELNPISLKHAGIVWTAGVSPSIPFGLPEDCLNDGRVSIERTLAVKGIEHVFAIGDIASSVESPFSATAQVAMQQGELLAQNLMAQRQSKALQNFEFIDRGEMITLGLGDASITSLGFTVSGQLAYKIRRMTYLAKLPTFSLSLRSAGAWLIGHGKKGL